MKGHLMDTDESCCHGDGASRDCHGDGASGDTAAEEEVHTEYFTAYEDLAVHELMLKDEPRTQAYKYYIEENPELFKDKVVIDVGAGTGILSLFAAKAGAKKVYAIEASSLATLCQDIVDQNDYTDVIQVIHGRVEDVQLPITQADVLISEWMGFYLLHEAMLDSVITARDKWLSPDGVMVPSSATIHVAPVTMKDYLRNNVKNWANVYGFNYAPFAEAIQRKIMSQPVITTIDQSHLLALPEMISHLELMYVGHEDVENVRSKVTNTINKNGILHGFAFWFDCGFEGKKEVILSTSPNASKTHWEQTVVLLPDALLVSKQETVSCSVEICKDKNIARRYNITLEVLEEEEEDSQEEEEVVEDGANSEAMRDAILQQLS